MGSSITKHVAGNETSGSEQGDCDYCQRRGLPIFPVRYAVCQRTDANEGIPELSVDRISAFTDIKLDQTLDNGETNTRVVPEVVRVKIPHSTSSQVNKYILRQLRSGYLYLFDKDNTDGIYWHGFAITSDGKYYKFPVKQPPALDKISFPCALSEDEQQEGKEEVQRKTSEAMHASIVTLPEPSKSGDVYYAYTEFAWPEDFLDEVEEKILSGDAWCDKYLQKLNIPSWDSGSEQTHAFAIDEFQNVAEFSDGAEGVKSHFLTSGDSRELYTREDMEDAMGSSARYEGRGLILAVNDEIGIVQELNAYRHEALAAVEDFFDPENKIDSKRIVEERRRKLLCKNAIDTFKDNFEKNYNSTELGKLEKQKKQIKAAIKERDAKADAYEGSDSFEAYRYKKAAQSGLLEEQLSNKGIEINNLNDVTAKDILRHKNQLDSLYDKHSLNEFESQYDKHTSICKSMLFQHDGDYSAWVIHCLDVITCRTSEVNFYAGVQACYVVAEILKGGILSSESGIAWKKLSESFLSEDSALAKILFLNNEALLRQAISEIIVIPRNGNIAIETLSDWSGKFLLLKENSNKSVYYHANPSLLTCDVKSALLSVLGIVLNAFISLRMYAYNISLNGDAFSNENLSKALGRLNLYQQIIYMAGLASQEDKQMPIMLNFQLTLSEYYEFLGHVSALTSEKLDADNALKDIDQMSGSFAISSISSNDIVMLAIPVMASSKDDLKKKINIDDLSLEKSYQGEFIANKAILTETVRKIAESLGGDLNAAGKTGNVFLQTLCIIELFRANDFSELMKLKNKEDVVKLISFGASFGITLTKLLEGVQSTKPSVYLGAAINNPLWKIGGKVLGAVSGGASLYDGCKQFLDGFKKMNNSRRLDAARDVIMGGVIAVGGAITILAAIYAGGVVGLMATIVIGVFTVAVGGALLTLVSPAVQTWVSRSIVGDNVGKIASFKNLDEEQSSLNMVFQGVVVSIDSGYELPKSSHQYGGVDQYFLNDFKHQAELKKKIDINISLPKVKEFTLLLSLSVDGRYGNIFDYKYTKKKDQKLISGEDLRKRVEDYKDLKDNAVPEISASDKQYNFESTQLLDIDFDVNGYVLSIELSVTGVIASELYNDLFKIEA